MAEVATTGASTLTEVCSSATTLYAEKVAALPVVRSIFCWREGEIRHILSVIDTADAEEEYALYRLQGEVIASHPDERLLHHTANLARRETGDPIEELLGPEAITLYRRAS